MPPFQFRLKTLLRMREAVRDERRGELAEAYRAEEALLARMREVERDLEALKVHSRQGMAPGVLDVDALIDAQRYELLLLAQKQGLQQHQEALAAEIERRRQALVAADREVRVLEKLREVRRQEHLREEHRQDIKFLDEVAGRAKLQEGA